MFGEGIADSLVSQGIHPHSKGMERTVTEINEARKYET